MPMVIADHVKETTTTTGTGSVTLAGAVAGWNSFVDGGCVNGSGAYYEIRDPSSGQSEIGIGTWRTGGILDRTEILGWSPAGFSGDFAAGEKVVSLTAPAMQVRGAHARNPAGRTYWVRTDGSDNNTGLTNTAAGAFLTLKAAVNAAVAEQEPGINNVAICLGAGTFNQQGGLELPSTKRASTMMFSIQGAGDTTILSTTSSQFPTIRALDAGAWNINSLTISSSNSEGIICGSGSSMALELVTFGACAKGHVVAKNGGYVSLYYPTISGGCSAGAHLTAHAGGSISNPTPTTVSANVTLNKGWAYSGKGGGHFDLAGGTFTLGAFAVTGIRYDLNGNAVCYTNGGGASFLPGTVAGTTATGGQYL